MKSLRRNARIIALGLFTLWLAAAVGIADHPPLIGFVWILLLLILCAVLVCFRAIAYQYWLAHGVRGRRQRATLEGFAAGVAAALLLLLGGFGEPTVEPPALDLSIWFLVLGMIGALNALLAYAGVAWLDWLTKRDN